MSDPAAIALVDHVTAHILARAAPVELRVATTDAEREAAFRLRCRAVVERGWRPREDFPDGLEREPIDDEAIHIVAWDGATAVGAVRLILPRPGQRLPLEEAFGIDVDPPGAYAEVTRITVAREHSDRSHRISVALLAAIWREARRHGYVHFIGDINTAMARFYRRIGFVCLPLGPPVAYWGEQRALTRFDMLASAKTLACRWLPSDQSR